MFAYCVKMYLQFLQDLHFDFDSRPVETSISHRLRFGLACCPLFPLKSTSCSKIPDQMAKGPPCDIFKICLSVTHQWCFDARVSLLVGIVGINGRVLS